MLLAACGSSDKAEPKEVILDLRLGTGFGSGFAESVMTAGETSLSLGDQTLVSVNIVDLNDDGNLYTDGNQTVSFASSCESLGLASFSSDSVTTSSGLAVTTYTASGCSGTDVITSTLSSDSSQSATVTLSTDNYSLSMGSGTGNSFEAEIIEVTDSSLDFGDTATLTVNIVDTNDSNDLFTDEEVSVVFSSSCISSGLSSLSESLVTTTTGIASTTYTVAGCDIEDVVTASLEGKDETAEITLTTQSNDLRLGTGSSDSFAEGLLTSSVSNLSATGQTELSVNIVDVNNDNALYTSEELTVVFSSACVNAGTSTFSASSVSTSSGFVNTTYTANGCRGDDVITATLSSSEQTAEVAVNVAEPELGSISSIVPEDTVLAIQGFSTDTLPSTGEVSFRVRDKSGEPISDKEVRFNLSGGTGGVNFSRDSDLSDSDGLVSVFVNSGTANTTFRVIAETDVFTEDGRETEQIMQTSSTTLTVNTGMPIAGSFGTGVSLFNPYAWRFINQDVDVVVTASDYHGGPVANGNSVTFKTSGGQIQLKDGQVSSCTILEGDCGMLWESGPIYPEYNVEKFVDGEITVTTKRGIAVIMAHTTGEESFIDENSNGLFDLGETYFSLSEAFHDVNLSNTRDSGEFFVDQNSNGQWDDITDEQKYRGASCSDEAREDGHCSQLAELFVNSSIIMATRESDLTFTARHLAVVFKNETTSSIEAIDDDGAVSFIESINADAYQLINEDGTKSILEFNDGDTLAVDISERTRTVEMTMKDLNGNVPAYGTELTRIECTHDIVAEIPGVELPSEIGNTRNPLESEDYPFTWGIELTSPDALDDEPNGYGDNQGWDEEYGRCTVVYTTASDGDGSEVSVTFKVVY